MTKSKLWFAILMVLVLSVSVSAFDGLELEDTKGIIDDKEIGEIKPIEEVKYCIRADTKEYMPCSEWTKGDTKIELESTQKLLVSMEGTYLYDSKTDTKEFWASKEEASVYVHKVRIDDRGQKVYHVDNLNPVPVDAYVSFWYEQQPGMLWHKNKHSQIVRGYYPSDWTWVQEYTWSDEEGQVVPFGGTLTFLAYDLTENSVGSEQFLVGSFALDDVFYANNTIANQVNFAQNGSGFGKQFYPGNATNVTIADGAMVFNGNNSNIFHSNGFAILKDVGMVTIQGWFKVDSNNSMRIVSNRYNLTEQFGIGYRDSTGKIEGAISNTSGGSNYWGRFASTNPVNLGQWYYFAVVYNGSLNIGTANTSFYINGVLQSGSSNVGNAGNNNGFSIGALTSVGNFFNGSIDDVRIFNRALNATEVSAMYNQGRGSYSVIGNGLVAQYSGRDYNGTTDNVTEVYDTNHLVSSGPITIANGSGIWAQPYNLTSKTAITFDGVDDYINTNITDNSYFNGTNGFSLMAWIRPLTRGSGGTNNYGRIFDKSSGSTNQNGFSLYMGDVASDIRFRVDGGTTTGVGNILNSINYSFVSVVIRQNMTVAHVSFFVNGLMVAENLSLGKNISSINTSNSVIIGNIIGASPSRGFNGSIADVRIYNTSLTPEEVYQIYSGQEIATPAVFVSGLNQDYYRGDSVPVNVAVTGTAIDSVWYNLNGVNSTYTPGLSLSLLTGEYQLRAYANNTLGMIGSSALYSFRMSDVPKGCDDIRLGVNDSFSLASIALIILAAVSIIGILTVGFGGGMSEGVDVKVMIATLIVTGILLSVGIVLFNVITASIC